MAKWDHPRTDSWLTKAQEQYQNIPIGDHRLKMYMRLIDDARGGQTLPDKEKAYGDAGHTGNRSCGDPRLDVKDDEIAKKESDRGGRI
jgi:hypothetical protein